MEAKELLNLGPEELQVRLRGWREELFKARLNRENKDTSVFRKLKRDIARALTVLNQKRTAEGKGQHGSQA